MQILPAGFGSCADVIGRISRFKLAGCQVNFEQTSLRSLRYPDNTFDAATCISVLEHTGQDVKKAPKYQALRAYLGE